MIKVTFRLFLATNVLLFLIGIVQPSLAVELPFTEDFETRANWTDAALNPLGLTLVDAGGPDNSSYVSQQFGFAAAVDDDTPVLFRAQDEFNSSEGAFEGDWINESVGVFSAFVRHDLPLPASFFTRFSGPANFPGAIAVEFVPVFPNTWTEISFDIEPENPEFVSFEDSDFESVFSNVGHVQIGVRVPEGFGGNPVPWTFDIDQASVATVPEPVSAWTLGLVILLSVALRVRRQH